MPNGHTARSNSDLLWKSRLEALREALQVKLEEMGRPRRVGIRAITLAPEAGMKPGAAQRVGRYMTPFVVHAAGERYQVEYSRGYFMCNVSTVYQAKPVGLAKLSDVEAVRLNGAIKDDPSLEAR